MSKFINHKYNYFYRITNLINGHFYYGVHSTDNINDGYMGSGKRLKMAYKKYGMENFEKEILKFFDDVKDAYEYEELVVSEEMVNNNECYNISLGGSAPSVEKGYAVVKDNDNNVYRVSVDDPRYLSRELKPISSGLAVVKDNKGNIYHVSVDDPRYLSGELVSIMKGKIRVRDCNNQKMFVSVDDPRYLCGDLIQDGFEKDKCNYRDREGNIIRTYINDPRVLSGELKHVTYGRVTVKDKHGNFYSVSINDPRYISGELIPNCKGHKLSDETKKKLSNNHVDNAGSKNGQYGKHWYKKEIDGKFVNICLTDEEAIEYIKNGWIKGRYLDKDIHGKVKKKVN